MLVVALNLANGDVLHGPLQPLNLRVLRCEKGGVVGVQYPFAVLCVVHTRVAHAIFASAKHEVESLNAHFLLAFFLGVRGTVGMSMQTMRALTDSGKRDRR